MARARSLAGMTIGELGQRMGYRVPPDLSGHKGFVGQLVEVALGAHAGSDPEPDFVALGIELKTLPLSAEGRPLESTYVCLARLDGREGLDFKASHVGRKLEQVLFVPMVADPVATASCLAERRLGRPFLWVRDAEEEALLAADFERLQGLVLLGQIDEVRATEGVALQLRPKAMDRSERTLGRSDEGWLVPVQPRGWYLRASFTATLVQRAFGRVLAPR
ncbi:MAG: DNA mismatch repair protein MutH [Deltaproteobacteria bacterium]|jgi:DNA mismatch repair protein MutH|nr:DNA mismatch repair protein MutH [Deltaproteobacteria bacterium]